MMFIASQKTPAFWGMPSSVARPQTSVPDGPHEWETKDLVRRCRKCEVEVMVGTEEPERALARHAGLLCSDALAIDVLGS